MWGNVTDIFPLFSNLFPLESESAFAVTNIVSLFAFLEVNKITFYRRDGVRPEPSSRLSGPIRAVCYGWGGQGSGTGNYVLAMKCSSESLEFHIFQ